VKLVSAVVGSKQVQFLLLHLHICLTRNDICQCKLCVADVNLPVIFFLTVLHYNLCILLCSECIDQMQCGKFKMKSFYLHDAVHGISFFLVSVSFCHKLVLYRSGWTD